MLRWTDGLLVKVEAMLNCTTTVTIYNSLVNSLVNSLKPMTNGRQ